ncbi:MAG: isoprenylcysteine carboxylmethyltransferase family protein [Novosphingobium sp.]
MSGSVIWRMLPSFTLHPQVVLVLASELAAVFFLLIQRKGTWSSSFYTTAIAFLGTGAALLVYPIGEEVAPVWITFPLITFGTAITLVAKLSLRRSFGLIPANRGVKIGGAYRFVRHPMYTGYVMNHVGLLLVYFSAWNLCVYLVAWVLLYLRAIEEEKFLLKDPQYVDYASKVKARMIPGLV